MFTFMGCAEPMLPMCQLKVKVTIEGEISNNKILDIVVSFSLFMISNSLNLSPVGSAIMFYNYNIVVSSLKVRKIVMPSHQN